MSRGTSPGPNRVSLANGQQVELRPLGPQDRTRIAASFERMSEQSRYRRFFLRLQELPPKLLDGLVDVDHADREAIVAIEPGSGELLGVARYTRDANDLAAAEIAVTVVDDWQRRGLGTALLEALTSRAREEGVERFTAAVLGENSGAMALLGQLGTAAKHLDHGVVELVVDLPAQRGAGERLRDALRAAASGALVPARTLADHIMRD